MEHFRLAKRYKNSPAPMFAYYFISTFAFDAPFAFIVTYLARIGISSAQIGIILAMRMVASIIGKLIWGRLADRSKSINKILVIISVGSILSGVAFCFARGFFPILVVCMAYFLFFSANTPITDTICLNMVETGEISNYGKIRVMASLGYVASVAITGVLSQINPVYIFYVVIGVGIISVASIFLTKTVSGRQKKGMKFNGFRFFAQKNVLPVLILYMVTQYVYGFADTVFSVYFSINLGAGDSLLGYSIAIRVSAEFFFLPLLGKIQKVLPFKNGILIFAFISILRYLICASTSNIAVLTIIPLLTGLSSIGIFVYVMTYLNSLTPPQGKATIQSLLGMFACCATMLGNFSTGFFMPDSAKGVSHWFFLIPAAFFALCGIFFAIVQKTPDGSKSISANEQTHK